AFESGGPPRPPAPGGQAESSFSKINSSFESLLDTLQDSDAAPTTQAVAAASEFERTLTELLACWSQFKSTDVKALNDQLRGSNLPPLDSGP
ncbi:MAG: hypothetical protein WCD76_09310, partial [Pyrinomonadaceae bacterium]